MMINRKKDEFRTPSHDFTPTPPKPSCANCPVWVRQRPTLSASAIRSSAMRSLLPVGKACHGRLRWFAGVAESRRWNIGSDGRVRRLMAPSPSGSAVSHRDARRTPRAAATPVPEPKVSVLPGLHEHAQTRIHSIGPAAGHRGSHSNEAFGCTPHPMPDSSPPTPSRTACAQSLGTRHASAGTYCRTR